MSVMEEILSEDVPVDVVAIIFFYQAVEACAPPGAAATPQY
jgi:hypothetical protein